MRGDGGRRRDHADPYRRGQRRGDRPAGEKRIPVPLGSSGAGAQGRSHLEAMLVYSEIARRIYGFTTSAGRLAKKYKTEMEEKFGRPITISDSVRDAVKDADIVCTFNAK